MTTRTFWLYELGPTTPPNGQVFQGVEGEDGDKIIAQVREEGDGEPFKVYAFEGFPNELEMHRADFKAVQAAGFHDPGELLAAYKLLAQHENAAQRKIDRLVELLNRLRPIIQDIVDNPGSRVSDVVSAYEFEILAQAIYRRL